MPKGRPNASLRGVAARIDEKGRLLLPLVIRRSLGLRAGDAVYCRSCGGMIHCVKATNPFDELAEHAVQDYRAGRTRDVRASARTLRA